MKGITLSTCRKLGDQIIFSSIPENYYRNFGEKLVDVDNRFVFDYNPFVVRGEVKPTEVVNLWSEWLRFGSLATPKTLAHKLCVFFNMECFLAHPRLYRFEDEYQLPKSVTVHTSGVTVGAMPHFVIAQILRNYADYNLFQIGGKTDVSIKGFDRRGCEFWESARYIAGSEIYIGIDSSMLHVAMAYPRTRVKVVLLNKTKEELEAFTPFTIGGDHKITGWTYANCEHYNCFDRDIGITRSYLKI